MFVLVEHGWTKLRKLVYRDPVTKQIDMRQVVPLVQMCLDKGEASMARFQTQLGRSNRWTTTCCTGDHDQAAAGLSASLR